MIRARPRHQRYIDAFFTAKLIAGPYTQLKTDIGEGLEAALYFIF
jgi:hypothetical protein